MRKRNKKSCSKQKWTRRIRRSLWTIWRRKRRLSRKKNLRNKSYSRRLREWRRSYFTGLRPWSRLWYKNKSS